MHGCNKRLRRIPQDGQATYTHKCVGTKCSCFHCIIRAPRECASLCFALHTLFLSVLQNIVFSMFQKRHRGHRDTLIANTSKGLHAHVGEHPLQAVNFRNIFESELFGLAMKEVSIFYPPCHGPRL